MPPTILKILFVEDSMDDIELMTFELKSQGIEISFRQVLSKKEFLTTLYEFKPDIILADYSLPAFNGMHAFRLFKEKNIPIPFILVSGTLTEGLIQEYAKEGLDDFLLKSEFKRLPNMILRNIQIKKTQIELIRVNSEIELLKESREKERLHRILSEREYQILCLIAGGKTIKEIAQELFLSPATVATYRSRLLEKLNLKSNVELTRFAIENKLID